MSEDPRPIDMNRCGEWNSAGIELWNVVDRSWSVYARNTMELIEFLKAPMRDPAILSMVMTDGPAESSTLWDELAQRLQNQIASIASLVDHTRPLITYYEADAADLVTQFKSRNETIQQMEQAAFLRDLRNYFLHRGHAPIISTLTFGTPNDSPSTSHAFKVNAKAVLSWKGWKAPARAYLSKFGERDGPVIIKDVTDHAKAMQDLYYWLFEQRRWVVALTPDRFRIGMQCADETCSGEKNNP